MRRITILIIALALMVLGASPAWAGDLKEISAKALTDHSCNSSEWHFVITQVDSEANAPASIDVTFSGGETVSVPLDKYTGKTAHYTEVSHLDETVVSATTSIYDGWSGQFNLSHGPCDTPPTNGDLTCPGEIVIPITTRAHGEEGSTQLLASFNVADSSLGVVATVVATAMNQNSTHEGNDLIIATGGDTLVLPDVEGDPGQETIGSGEVTLGSSVTISVMFGEDGTFSAGITVTFTCESEVVFPVASAEAVCEGEVSGYDVTVTANSAIDDIAVVDSADYKFTKLEGSYAEGESRTEFVAADQVTGPLLLLYRSEPIQLLDLPPAEDCEVDEETTTTTQPKVEDTSTTAPPTTKATTATTTPVQNGDFGDGPNEGSFPVGLASLVTLLFGAATIGGIYRSRLSR